MNLRDAIDFLSPAVDRDQRIWADLGAGSGTFTAALAHILPAHATIYAVDNDARNVHALRQLRVPRTGPAVVPIEGDAQHLHTVAELPPEIDAAVLANVLHFFQRPSEVLMRITARMRTHGPIVLVEYDRTAANQWVPYPVPVADVPRIAAAAGLDWQGTVSERPSRYQGRMYCGVLTRAI
jgi:SAM-dependent methyltransferase